MSALIKHVAVCEPDAGGLVGLTTTAGAMEWRAIKSKQRGRSRVNR